MDHPLDWEPPALRLARLRLEVTCLDARLAAERRRQRRDLDAPLAVPCVPRREVPRGRHPRS